MLLLSYAFLCLFTLLSSSASATVGSSAEHRPVSITVALKQPGVVDAAQELYRLSDPTSTSYGLYWTPRQVARFFAPGPDSTQNVLAWLAEIGIPRDQVRRSHQGHELSFVVPRSAFNATSSSISHTRTTRSIPIPSEIEDHVDFIIASIPTPPAWPQAKPRLRRQTDVSTPTLPNQQVEEDNEASCHMQTTPTCLRRLYHIPGGNTSHPNNSLGIFLPAWMTWLPQDLDAFFHKFQPESVGRQPVISAINGGYRQFDSQIDPFNLEANLDFEYAMALTHPLPVTNIQVGERDLPGPQIGNMLAAFDKYYCGALDPSIDAIPPTGGVEALDCGTVTPSNVLSISYTWPETDYPSEYLQRQCLEFLKLGLQGVTVIVATGDAGVGSHPDGYCIDPVTGTSNTTSSSGAFIPNWPASCPWVTAVGGTAHADADRVVAWRNLPSASLPRGNVSEVAYRRAFNNKTRSSAGGFSRVFARPEYQKQAVREYLAAESGHLDAFRTRFNASGRAYPDVAAMATGYQVVTSGSLKTVHGTSASAPVVAAIIARINDARLYSGKGPVGFINPVLYRYPEALNDITLGASAGCGVEEAFAATKGWDAVTGLGTPDYERLLEVFMALP